MSVFMWILEFYISFTKVTTYKSFCEFSQFHHKTLIHVRFCSSLKHCFKWFKNYQKTNKLELHSSFLSSNSSTFHSNDLITSVPVDVVHNECGELQDAPSPDSSGHRWMGTFYWPCALVGCSFQGGPPGDVCLWATVTSTAGLITLQGGNNCLKGALMKQTKRESTG